jgi:hypothetical protein
VGVVRVSLALTSGRRRAAIAANVALGVLVTGLVVVAGQQDGYTTHEARLNDGGIWVTDSRGGFHGRVNKPIGQLDGAAFVALDTQLDVVQEGAAVLAVDVSSGTLAPIDPGRVLVSPGEIARLPEAGRVALAGGTAAVLDPASGDVWAERVDPRYGLPPVAGLDRGAEPVATTAPGAAAAVTHDGDVLVVSASDDVVRRIVPYEDGFAAPTTAGLGADVDLAPGSTVTAVGGRAVVLDPGGVLRVVDGAEAEVPAGSVLQAPGPDADAVLVATPTSLVSVDLGTGATTEVAPGAGTPAPPVRLGACSYAAWSGATGSAVTACSGAEPKVGDLGSQTTDLVFRVNRGEIVLNDRTSGAVWDLEPTQPTRMDDWDAFQSTPEQDDDETDTETDDGDRRPPRAEDDDLGARLGRTTVLHPLDNDAAPDGRLLAITSVRDVSDPDADVAVSPDGQTVQVTLPDDAGPTSFEYVVDDGRRGLSDTATVRLTPRGDAVNAPPALREGFEDRRWTVPSGGTLDVPVLPDWRDEGDGDPLALSSAVAEGGEESGAEARTTSSGRVRFTAPARSGVVTVRYGVTDGIAEPVEHELEVVVQDPQDRKAHPGTAEPDVVSGEVGRTITIRPLANDLPGSDPVTPTAQVELAARLAPVDGADVRTDLVDGTVRLTADQPRTYVLDYELRYGNAPFDQGRIRVDVRAGGRTGDPVAVPDSVTLRGQVPTLLDVTANDVDPAGGILVVQDATARGKDLDVAVVDGRWLRLSAPRGALSPDPQVVRYTISNGTSSGIRGEVVVSWRPPPDDATPVTEADRVTVRAGRAVSVPVLDNDVSPDGGELALVADTPDRPAGELEVRASGDGAGPTGTAYAAGRLVRYVAPESLADAETFTVRYVAVNDAGGSAPGTLEVEVVPPGDNLPPEPGGLEGRVVAGRSVDVRLPVVGADPDGDPVTLSGVASAPGLGRVVGLDGTSLTYQAFPDSVGTDVFEVAVVDDRGGEASATVRVAVTEPGPAAPPLAVADVMTAEPGRTVRVDVLANDRVDPGDEVAVELVGELVGARVEGPRGPLLLDVPADATDDVEVVYALGNGVGATRATVTVRVARPFDNPPVVPDAFGAAPAGPDRAAAVTVDVLDGAHDPDGDSAALRVTDVLAPRGVEAEVEGSSVTVARGDRPLVVPFRVEDAAGSATTASLYVPPLGRRAPYVVPDAVVEVDPGATTVVDLADVVVDPAGGPVRLTVRDRVVGSPLTVVRPTVLDEQRLEVAAAPGRTGPGAIVLEVTTGESVDDPDGVVATVSVPVQVGPADPILRCPEEPVEVTQDSSLDLDVSSLCHVWTPDPDAAASLTYDADWEASVEGLAIVQPSGSRIEVNAAAATPAGATATLLVRTGGGAPGRIGVVVVEAPPPVLAPVRVDDLGAGDTRSVDLAAYLRPGVGNADPTVLEVQPVGETEVEAVPDGSAVRITAGPGAAGRAEFTVVMSDVAGSTGAERRTEGRLVVTVRDVPGRPAAPVPAPGARDREVLLRWRAPATNGAPIDRYQVRAGGGVTQDCAGTVCDVRGLVNGRAYRFEVRAHNAEGWSAWSPRSAPATPDARPGRVGPITMVERGDRRLRLRWTPPAGGGSAVTEYVVSWPGGGSAVVRRPEVTASGLDNDRAYAFTVFAVNRTFSGERRTSARFQSIGTPPTPARPSLTTDRTGSDAAAVVLRWPAVRPNGPGPVRYTVLRNGRPLPACSGTTGTRCVNQAVAYDGDTYTYAVRATNDDGRGLTSPVGPAASYRSVGRPEGWGAWTATPTGRDRTARLQFRVPDANGARSRVRVLVRGQAVRTTQASGAQTLDVALPDNDRAHDVALEVCNEADRCSTSTAKPVQTYGPLTRAHVVSAVPVPSTVVRNGYEEPALAWRITLDTNGDPARVRLSSNVRTGTHVIPGVDRFTFTTRTFRVGWGRTERLRVVLEDVSPARGPVRRTYSHSFRDAPRPSVRVSRGNACNDERRDPACNNGTRCVHRSCGRIKLVLEDFPSRQVTCRFYDNVRRLQPWQQRDLRTNATLQPGPSFGEPGKLVWVRCDGAPESNRFRWPSSAA